MKTLKPWIVAVLAAALTLSVIGVASAQPTPPSTFMGTVTSPDGEVAAGLSVEAYVGETLCNTRDTETYADSAGVTRYWVSVHNSSTEAACGGVGAEIRFQIGGQNAVETATRTASALATVNLTLAPAAPETVTIDVAVWRRNEDPFNALADLYISTRAPSENWITHDDEGPLTMTLSSSGNWHRSDLTPVTVDLGDGSSVTIDVAVWRNVADPTRLFISTRAPGENWITHDDDGPLTMTVSSSGNWYRSDLTAIEVDLP